MVSAPTFSPSDPSPLSLPGLQKTLDSRTDCPVHPLDQRLPSARDLPLRAAALLLPPGAGWAGSGSALGDLKGVGIILVLGRATDVLLVRVGHFLAGWGIAWSVV